MTGAWWPTPLASASCSARAFYNLRGARLSLLPLCPGIPPVSRYAATPNRWQLAGAATLAHSAILLRHLLYRQGSRVAAYLVQFFTI